MTRRGFVGLLGGSIFFIPFATQAQTGNKARVGLLHPGPASSVPSRIAALFDGLRAVGYSEQQVEVIWRAADSDPARLTPLASELAGLKVTAAVAVTMGAVRALQMADPTIPILAQDLETDPVTTGFIQSYNRPGGNVTGVFFDFPDFRGKWLELLRESLPNLSSVALLWDPATGTAQLKELETAISQLHLKATPVEVRTMAELNNALSVVKQEAVDAVLLLSSPLFGTRPQLVAEMTLRHQLPAITLFPDFARAGGLLAYGPNILDTYRPLGMLLGKVLRGERPGSLPVERPAKFELVINMKTAKSLGISIPTSVLLRADEVIE